MKVETKFSWKTTLCGIVSGLGATLSQMENPTLQVIGQFLLPIGTMCTGYYAKDNGVGDD